MLRECLNSGSEHDHELAQRILPSWARKDI